MMRRIYLPWLALFFLLLFGPLAVSSRAQHKTPPQNSPTGPDAGRELVAKLLAIRPEENVHWSGTLIISGRETKALPIPIDCETTLGETNWSVTYLAGATATNGAEKLTITFSTNAPPQYLYARAPSPNARLGETKTLSGAEADIPLADSDFWLSDLGFEFYHWPVQNRLMSVTRRNRGCYVLESVNPHPKPGGYTRVVTWVDAESNQPLQAEAHGADDSVIKAFEVGRIERVHDHYEVKDLKMFNRVTDSRTSLVFNSPGQ
jgi:Outer membrane lipoprotein-sorting protein